MQSLGVTYVAASGRLINLVVALFGCCSVSIVKSDRFFLGGRLLLHVNSYSGQVAIVVVGGYSSLRVVNQNLGPQIKMYREHNYIYIYYMTSMHEQMFIFFVLLLLFFNIYLCFLLSWGY